MMSSVPTRLPSSLQTASDRYHLFIENAREVFFQADTQGVWTFLNPAWERITGFSVEKSIGTSCFAYVYPNDRQRNRDLFRAIINEQVRPERYELRYRTADQYFCWMQMDICVDRSPEGDIIGVSGTLTEIGDLKQYEASTQLLQTLIQAITEAHDFSTALQVTLCQVCEVTGWDYGEVWIKLPDREAIQLSPVWYSRLDSLTMFWQLSQAYVLPIDDSIPGYVWQTQQPEWISDIAELSMEEFSRVAIAEEAGLNAGFIVPIVANGEVIALLAFFLIMPRPEDRQLVKLVTAVAQQLGSVMQNKRAEGVLRQAEEKYRSIFEHAREGIFQMATDGRFLSVNPALAKLLHYSTPKQLVHTSCRPYWQLYLDSDRHYQFVKLLSRRDAITNFEAEVCCRDRQVIWVSISARSVKDSRGRILYFEGTLVDVTERKQAELSLEKTFSLMQATLDSISDGIMAVDLRGNLISYNQRFLEMWGISEAIMTNPPQRQEFLANQVHDAQAFCQRVQALYDQPDVEGWDTLECLDGRVFERYSRPQWLGDTIVGRVWDYRDITQRKQAETALREQKQQSEQLLLNILPAAIAEQLKQNQHSIADSFPDVTVMFADIVDFSSIADHTSPKVLVDLLNQIFSAFDRLAGDYGLEKIKTIGDAYMVVGGLPTPRPDHVEAIADLALAMRDAIQKIPTQATTPLSLRIGIHTGPVVAGVIGISKFSYDLWGDAVNIASRMESQGLAGCIQVSSVVYDRLHRHYHLQRRGAIPIKGKGEMITYLLEGKKSD